MSAQDEVNKRLFTPAPKAEVKTEAKPQRAKVKRKLPDKDAQIVDAISKAVDSYNKKRKKRPISTRTPYGYDYDWRNREERKGDA